MRKRGAGHSRLAVVPLGVKGTKYEINARAGMVALGANVANIGHLADLYVLAEMCDALTAGEPHIRHHCASVRRLCDEIHGADMQCGELRYVAMDASAQVLLDYFHSLPNAAIARTALHLSRKLAA